MKNLLILTFVTFIGCKSIEEKIDLRINLFEKYSTQLFDSIYVMEIRELLYPKTLDFIVTKVDGDFKGYMQVKPEKFWDNSGDTLSQQFLEVFSKLDCRKLYNFNNFVFIEFLDNKKRVIVFKGNKNISNYFIETVKPIKLKNNWSYIIVDFK